VGVPKSLARDLKAELRKQDTDKAKVIDELDKANNLQQSWRFDWEPPKAVLRDVRTIDWILGG
jgi:hypothetical protein